MGASFCYLSRPRFHWKIGGSQTALYSCKCETVLKATIKNEKWLLNRDLSHLGVKPHTQQRLCLNCWIPKSKHTIRTSNTGSADLHVYSKILVFFNFNQVLKPIRAKDQTIESFSIFLNFLFQSGENSREIPTAKPRDTCACESETLLLRLLDFCKPYPDKISLT